MCGCETNEMEEEEIAEGRGLMSRKGEGLMRAGME
jgi:hypothetical protein